ncbi:hypothetical protein [Microbulbifer sp. SAOS-129_SWC]|uniref:tetratricopeptide repeat protein n=1 Tax=Microbulbifer sp. SAOS-129_SWC TaxID=3145235 RepID=UPI003217436E
MLNAEELFHLGLHSLEKDDVGESLSLFKRCVEMDEHHAKATYMVGALYAQIQMLEPAIDWLQKAIELDASEKTAVFQLGLLHLTSGDVEESATVWRELDDLKPDHPFKLFSAGMTALVKDDFALCIEKLSQGIENNDFNTALNDDMRRVIASAEAAMENRPGEAVVEHGEVTPNAASAQRALSGYKQSLKGNG